MLGTFIYCRSIIHRLKLMQTRYIKHAVVHCFLWKATSKDLPHLQKQVRKILPMSLFSQMILIGLRGLLRSVGCSSSGSTDIIDEAINFFRANVLFRKFEVKGPADKLLVYLTLYINMALKRIEACKTEADGVKAIISLGLEKFPLPGEPGFPLSGLFTSPKTKEEGGRLFFPTLFRELLIDNLRMFFYDVYMNLIWFCSDFKRIAHGHHH